MRFPPSRPRMLQSRWQRFLVDAGALEIFRFSLEVGRRIRGFLLPHGRAGRWYRFTLGHLMAFVILMALLFGLWVKPAIRDHNRLRQLQAKQDEYRRIVTGISATVFALRSAVPKGVEPSKWTEALDLTGNAVINTCYCHRPPTVDTLRGLQRDMTAKLQGAVTVDVLSWIWDRLAESSPDGRAVNEEFRPELERRIRAIAVP
jgi:hypothetical protein